MRFLCVFAVPRTGSSHLNKLLRSCPEIVGKSELFHRHQLGQLKPVELRALSKWSDGAVTDALSFRQWKRDHPLETLEALHEASKDKVIAFKVFAGHLMRESIEALFLPRDDMTFAILRRRPIESYISTVKAKAGEKFTLVDTTAVKPELDIENFKLWMQRAKDWYDWVQQALEARGRPYAEIGFEKHFEGNSGEESLRMVLAELEKAGLPGMTVPKKIIEGERQDRESDYRARVANWDAFESRARANRKLSRLLDWAETVR
jgi:LPS sulfotransferase NodH